MKITHPNGKCYAPFSPDPLDNARDWLDILYHGLRTKQTPTYKQATPDERENMVESLVRYTIGMDSKDVWNYWDRMGYINELILLRRIEEEYARLENTTIEDETPSC